MRWFTADLHFGHENIIRYSGRPFGSVDQMNRAMIDRFNERVGVDDEVWILGDLAMGRLADTLPLVNEMNGTITLLCGNHDQPWKGRSPKTRAKGEAKFASTKLTLRGGETVWLDLPGGLSTIASHFPYSGDSGDIDRHVDHRPTDNGDWLLHGHVHEKWRQRGRQINVGVDAWAGRPVSEHQLAELIAAGPTDRPRLDWSTP